MPSSKTSPVEDQLNVSFFSLLMLRPAKLPLPRWEASVRGSLTDNVRWRSRCPGRGRLWGLTGLFLDTDNHVALAGVRGWLTDNARWRSRCPGRGRLWG